MNTKLKVKKLREGAKMPVYGSAFAAGADLTVCTGGESVTVNPGETVLVGTGLALEIPTGYVGLIYGRSGTALKRGLAPANKVGVIDSDYRGEVKIALHNHSNIAATVEDGERVAQLVITPYLTVDFEESAELSDTSRGEGGFGSTGNK